MATLATARVTAAQPDGLLVGTPDPTLPPIVFGHGAGVGPDIVMSGDGVGSLDVLQQLADLGFVVSVPTIASYWGNATAMTAFTNAITFARTQGCHPTRPAILLGASMGGGTCLKYAAANPASVLCVVGFITAFDFDAIIAADTLGLRSAVNAAWSRAAGDTSTLTAGINPSTLTTTLAQVHQQHWVATDDAVSANYSTYATATGCDMRTVGALGHSTAAVDAASTSEVLRYIGNRV